MRTVNPNIVALPIMISLFVISACLSLTTTAAMAADEPLYVQIDQQIDAKIKAGQQASAARSTDAEFMRRVYLDLSGEVPTAAKVTAFLADGSKGKRAKLIDQLLASPRYAEHMADVFHVMLMERRGKEPGWRNYLVDAFKNNKPWDQMATEMLRPDAEDKTLASAGFFITKRLEKYGQNPTDYPGLTRDVGRMFLGVDLQCAQCHNHLTVDDYNQVDFQGVYSVYLNLKLQNPTKDKPAKWVSEALMTEPVSFKSVFSGKEYQTPPRVPFGEVIAIPKLEGDAQWIVKPDRKKRIEGVPKFSPLRELTKRIATRDNAFFARNIANRLWFLMLGRGIIEPLDLAHSENAPSHPKLLQLLADEVIARKFEIKSILRDIALSETYQRSSVVPESLASSKKPIDESLYLVAKEKPIHAEALLRSVLIATGELDRVTSKADGNRKGEKDAKGSKEEEEKVDLFEDLQKRFFAAFANAAKEPELEVSPSLKAALFLRNDTAVADLLSPREGNLTARLLKLKTPKAIADHLYLSLLSRLPDQDEVALVAAFTKKLEDREKAIRHLAWALLSSVEFGVNH